MGPFKAYFRLQKLNWLRYWKSFPLVIQLLFLSLLCGLFVLLYKIDIDFNDFRLNGAIVCIYLFLCFNFSFEKSQKLLLNNYAVPIRLILLLRNLFLLIPVFILQWKTGFICFPLAFLMAFLRPRKDAVQARISRFKPIYLFRKGSYQWYYFYRQTGFYFHCIALFFICMGIIHENQNLSMASYLLLGVFSGIFSTMKAEPFYFVKVYENPNNLIRKKTLDIVYNISFMQLPVGILLIFFGLDMGFLAYIFFSTVVLSWASMAVKYSRYPDEWQAQFIQFLVVLPSIILCLVLGLGMLFVALLILLVAGYFMRRNLQTIFSPILD